MSTRTRSREADVESAGANRRENLRGKSYDEQVAMLSPSAPAQAKVGIGGFFSRLFGGKHDNDESAVEDKQKPSGRRKPKRSGGAGIALKHAGFTVPTGRLYKAGVPDTALRVALAAYDTAWAGKQTRNTTFTLVDFTKSDDERRLWVMDLQTGEVLRAEFVSHGYGSDGDGYKNNADRFGNVSGSGRSSLGLMRAGKMRKSAAKYRTKTDAREFDGLERGHNDKVRSRSIIMHAAISSKTGGSYANKNGVGGPSAGCWALDKDINTAVIKAIPPGSLLFNYYPDKRYMETSNYLREFRAAQRQPS